jgi:hypothetical protein
MPGATSFDDSFCGAMARADHQIVAIEIELFDGGGEQRQAMTVKPARAWNVLKEGSARPQPLDRWRDAAWNMEEREEICVWVCLAQDLEHFLAAAHPGQPVVDKRHARLGSHDNTSP